MKYIKWIVLAALLVFAAPAAACEVHIAAGDKCLGGQRIVNVTHGSPYGEVDLWVDRGTAVLVDGHIKLDKNGNGSTILTDIPDVPETVKVKIREGNFTTSATVTFEACTPPPPPPPPPVEPPVVTPPPVEPPPVAPPVEPAPEPVITPISEPVAPPPVTPPHVQVWKKADRYSVRAGGVINYVIRVRVSQGDAGLLKVCDILPNSLSYVSAPGATFYRGNACWFRHNVKPDTLLTFKVKARVDRGVAGVVCNKADAVANNSNHSQTRACVLVRKTVQPKPDIPVTG